MNILDDTDYRKRWDIISPIRIVIKFYMLYFLLLIFILYEMELQVPIPISSISPFDSLRPRYSLLYLNQYFAVYLAIIFIIPDVKNVIVDITL